MNGTVLALLLALAGWIAPPPQRTRPEVAPELERRFSALHQEFSAAVARSKEQPGPQREFAPRYAELARAGHPRAARWCIDFIGASADDPAARRELYLACEAVLVPHVLWAEESQLRHVGTAAQDYGVLQLLRSLRSAGAVVGNEKALELCQELFEKSEVPESKAAALETQAAILLTGRAHDAPPPSEVLELERQLAKEFPETSSGKRAAGQLFRMENLVIGKTAPDFATQDVEGVAFKLSDYRGKVVVLDFWGFW